MNHDGFLLKQLTKGGAILLVAGLVFMGLAEGGPGRQAAGLILAGLGVVLAFLPGAIAGQLILDPGRDTTDTNLGTAVRLWSAVMITIGTAIFLFGLIQLISPQTAARFAASRSALGVIFILGGSAVSFYNLVRILGLQAADETLRSTLSLFSARFSSFLGVLLGLFAVVAGLVMILAPDLPALLLRELLPPLLTPPA
jgi:hypothetical protein